jgi:hypothetical protein
VLDTTRYEHSALSGFRIFYGSSKSFVYERCLAHMEKLVFNSLYIRQRLGWQLIGSTLKSACDLKAVIGGAWRFRGARSLGSCESNGVWSWFAMFMEKYAE